MKNDILSNLIIKNVFSVNNYFSNKGASAKRIERSCWAFILKYEGETLYTCKGKKYTSNANSIVLLPKGASYEWVCLETGHFITIEFDCDQTLDEIMTFSPVNAESILNIFKKLERERIINHKYYRIACLEQVYRIILMLLKSSKKAYLPTSRKESLNDVLSYIAENYNRNIKNEELARLTPYSTVYFRKLFTETTGMSPITYIHTLRIQKAKEMLQSDYGNISDIAYTLGYTNIYEFSRMFKKYTGLSPTHYLKFTPKD